MMLDSNLFVQIDPSKGGVRLLCLESPNWIGELAKVVQPWAQVVAISDCQANVMARSITGSSYVISHVFQVKQDWRLFMLPNDSQELKEFVSSAAVPSPITTLLLPPEILKQEFQDKLCPAAKVGENVAHVGRHMVAAPGIIYNSTVFGGYVVEIKTYQLDESEPAVESSDSNESQTKSEAEPEEKKESGDVAASSPSSSSSSEVQESEATEVPKAPEAPEAPKKPKLKAVSIHHNQEFVDEVKERVARSDLGLRKVEK
jgi:hypothetical protein